MKQSVQLFGVNAEKRLLAGDQTLRDQVNRDLKSRGRCALAVSCLKNEELAVLNSELKILHITVVTLQLVGDVSELLVGLRHLLCQMVDGKGGAYAGHHVFTLGIHQVFAVELVLPGRGVS